MGKILLTLFVLVSFDLFAQTTINVPNDYTTIQEGLNAASEGDTVLVESGTYDENIIWPQIDNLFLHSVAGSSASIIDANSSGSPLQVSLNNSHKGEINGFSFTGGYLQSPTINCSNFASFKMKESEIYDNASVSYGGGISLSGDIQLLNCSIYDNFTSRSGGGVYVKNGVTLSNCLVYSNGTDVDGGGLLITGTTKILNCVITKNYLRGNRYGAGIVINASLDSILIMNSVVFGNYGGYGNLNGIMRMSGNLVLFNNYINYLESGFQRGEDNIFSNYDPFLNSAENNFDINYLSPLVDNGIREIDFYGDEFYAPTDDIEGKIRLDDSNTKVDIGAYELGYKIFIENLKLLNESLLNVIAHNPIIEFTFASSQASVQTGYEVHVSTDSTFSIIDHWNSGFVASTSTSIEYNGQSLMDGQTYYLRIRVQSNGDYSSWSEFKFKMNTVPSTPQILKPSNGDALYVQNPLVTFIKTIDSENDSVRYNIQVSSKANFSNIVSSVSNLYTTVDTVKWSADGLSDNQSYFIRANSFDGYEYSEYSETVNFYVNFANDAPNTFSLISPNKDGSTTLLKPTFIWNKATDIDPDDTIKYSLIVDTKEPGVVTFDIGTDTSYTLTNDLEDNSDYYWKIMAIDLSGSTRESEDGYWKFSVNTSNDFPLDFALLYPQNDDMVTTLTPIFRWEKAIDIDPGLAAKLKGITSISGYNLYINQSSDFSEVTPINISETSYEVTTALEENKKYFWKVEAEDNLGAIKSSTTNSFWTNKQNDIPDVFTLITPSSGSSITELKPSFKWSKSKDPDLQGVILKVS